MAKGALAWSGVARGHFASCPFWRTASAWSSCGCHLSCRRESRGQSRRRPCQSPVLCRHRCTPAQRPLASPFPSLAPPPWVSVRLAHLLPVGLAGAATARRSRLARFGHGLARLLGGRRCVLAVCIRLLLRRRLLRVAASAGRLTLGRSLCRLLCIRRRRPSLLVLFVPFSRLLAGSRIAGCGGAATALLALRCGGVPVRRALAARRLVQGALALGRARLVWPLVPARRRLLLVELLGSLPLQRLVSLLLRRRTLTGGRCGGLAITCRLLLL